MCQFTLVRIKLRECLNLIRRLSSKEIIKHNDLHSKCNGRKYCRHREVFFFLPRKNVILQIIKKESIDNNKFNNS